MYIYMYADLLILHAFFVYVSASNQRLFNTVNITNAKYHKAQ